MLRLIPPSIPGQRVVVDVVEGVIRKDGRVTANIRSLPHHAVNFLFGALIVTRSVSKIGATIRIAVRVDRTILSCGSCDSDHDEVPAIADRFFRRVHGTANRTAQLLRITQLVIERLEHTCSIGHACWLVATSGLFDAKDNPAAACVGKRAHRRPDILRQATMGGFHLKVEGLPPFQPLKQRNQQRWNSLTVIASGR